MITKTQVKQLREAKLNPEAIPEMDPEIVDVVIDLNKHGLTTLDSCAGHPGRHPEEEGMIFFGRTRGWAEPKPLKNDEYKKAMEIMHMHGLKNLKLDKTHKVISFKAFGKPWRKSKTKKSAR
jgi:hypothetical protein